MWNPFRKKSKRDEPTAQPRSPSQQVNRVEELANTLQAKGRIQELESELSRLDLSSLSEAEQEIGRAHV